MLSVVAGAIGVPSIVTVALAMATPLESRTMPDTLCEGTGFRAKLRVVVMSVRTSVLALAWHSRRRSTVSA